MGAYRQPFKKVTQLRGLQIVEPATDRYFRSLGAGESSPASPIHSIREYRMSFPGEPNRQPPFTPTTSLPNPYGESSSYTPAPGFAGPYGPPGTPPNGPARRTSG